MSAASDVFAALGGTAGIGAALYIAVPKLIETWRSRHRDDAEVAKVREREVTSRHRTEAKGTALAADVVRQRAAALDAREAEHAAERHGHLKCLQQVGRLEGEVATERSARQALERVVLWLLERVGMADEPPPDDVAQTIERIRPTSLPPAPEPAE